MDKQTMITMIEAVRAENYSSFLNTSEKARVTSKYGNTPFQEIFDALKSNSSDAILYIMNKYDPLLNTIYKKHKLYSMGKGGDYSNLFPIEDWKNEVFLYLSGAGKSKPFFDKFNPKVEDPSEEIMWKTFGYYLKNYLDSYFRKLVTAQKRQFGGQNMTSLDSSIDQDIDAEENSPGRDVSSPTEREPSLASVPDSGKSEKAFIKSLTDSEMIALLFDKYLFLLKEYSNKYQSKGKRIYQVTALRAQGKSFKTIAKILEVHLSTVYKALDRGKEKWLKFLNAHKETGVAPAKVEKKETNAAPIQG